MIKEAYVSLEVAKLLKEKGFDEDTTYVWYEHLPKENAVRKEEIGKPKMDYFYFDKDGERNMKYHNSLGLIPYINGEIYSAPTCQMTMAWLRENGWHIDVSLSYDDNENACYYVVIQNTKTFLSADTDIEEKMFKTYEEAVEAALLFCLTNLI